MLKFSTMYSSSSYAKPYSSGGSGGGASSSRQTTSSGSTTVSGDRPSSLNFQRQGQGQASGSDTGGGGGGRSHHHHHHQSHQSQQQQQQPHKPTRYNPVYPSLLSAAGTGTGASGVGVGPSSYSKPLGLTGSISPYAPSSYAANRPQDPPKSILGQPLALEPSSRYYNPTQRLHAHNTGQVQLLSSSTTNLAGSGATSKSAQNLMMDTSNIPDAFCLSCPPAEFKFSDAYRAKTLPRSGKENERLIGFATLPEQVHRKSVKKGFDFTLMVVGESGLGKSTLINSLFLADFYDERKLPSVNDRIKKTTSIQKHTMEIEERGVKLRLTVVDTPGFGDPINCEGTWKACMDYIEDQFHQYFQAESGLNRKHIQDGRVHCCLYFVPPYGRGLRPLDIMALKQLQTRVNIIPVIGKADTLTPTETRVLKEKILEDLRINQIQMYQFPECDEDEDEEFKKQDRELKAAIPFAIASSNTFVEVAGKRLRGRVYPWGIVEVENPNHSDFAKLRTMLIQSHMHDLKETTQDMHYENFRARAIAQIAQSNPRERTKLKRDSSYENAQDILLQKEAEIKRMQQMISKMEAKLKAQGRGDSIDI